MIDLTGCYLTSCLHWHFWVDPAVSEGMPVLQTMFQDCRKIFAVPSFVIILVAEIIMVIGGSGAGYQIMYFEVSCLGMYNS